MAYNSAEAARFLSTPSARRATREHRRRLPLRRISIHALREEGDLALHADFGVVGHDFYPRPPRGGRPKTRPDDRPASNFYPRPPRGGRLSSTGSRTIWTKFLSTPSARRATQHGAARRAGGWKFLSTPSARRATKAGIRKGNRNIFLSTPSARRATDDDFFARFTRQISIHALREEGDERRGRLYRKARYFYPRPPRGGRPARTQ